MIETFNDAVRFLESYIPSPSKRHPGKLGLERMQYLVSLLGNPHLQYPTIHVGGTSGKGSTATIIASILATKYRVGLHTSPHLMKVTERIKIFQNIKYQISNIKNTNKISKIINGEISEKKFTQLINEILPVIKKVEKSKFGKPSYFEIVAALAFLSFKRHKVDMAVIEVGMGGRYDGTNVVKPVVAVLTNVGLDHTEILGDTVEEIARDKVGIIKPGIKVVSGVKQPSVIKILEDECKKNNASLSILIYGFCPLDELGASCSFTLSASEGLASPVVKIKVFTYYVKRLTTDGSVFDYFGENTYKNLKLLLLGEYQVENASLAIQALECLNATMQQCNNATIKIEENEIRNGLFQAFIPGRLEIVSRKPLIVLDGAHNTDKMRALVASIKKIFPKRRVTAIIAIKNDKAAKGILEEFLKICQKVIFTKFRITSDQGVISSYEPEELLEIITNSSTPGEPLLVTPGVSLRLIENPQKALKTAVKEAKKDDLILVTGSLYLVGEVKKIFNDQFSIHNEFSIS